MASKDSETQDLLKRHCSFCLKFLPYKLCGGCHRRAYCSVKCEKEDELVLGNGQGHKNWCKLEHGQEDVDWEVRPSPGKGLGIFAKRPIPAMYRIIVEGLHYEPDSHPAIADLFPASGTKHEKFVRNRFGRERSYVALRIARCNHSCSPNASVLASYKSKLAVLYACRAIEEGEEICVSYWPVTAVKPDPELAGQTIDFEFYMMKRALYTHWGFTCPPECICNDPNFKQHIFKARCLYQEMHLVKESDQLRAVKIANEIVAVPYNELPLDWITKAEIYVEAAFFAVDHPEALLNQLEEAYKIFSALDPLSSEVKEIEDSCIVF